MVERLMRRLRGVMVSILATALMLGLSNSLFGQGSDGVRRVFSAWLPNTAAPTECPDFFGDDTRRIVVAGQEENGFVYFAAPIFSNIPEDEWQIRDQNGDVLVDIRNGAWVFAPTLHITSQGPDNLTFRWLDEVSPGVTCKTGPNGAVLVQKTFLIAQISDGADPNDGAWYVVNSGATRRICVGIALFNR